tara:strand:+ start:387 stop:566 length:180 start_codon:yes stop_codon:yes gene_type:complete
MAAQVNGISSKYLFKRENFMVTEKPLPYQDSVLNLSRKLKPPSITGFRIRNSYLLLPQH